jgi:uncharacterized protein (DUF1330 family)
MRFVRRAAVRLPVLLFLTAGCANMTGYGPENGFIAERQRLAAANIEKAVVPLRPLLGGREASVRINGTATPVARYVQDVLREMAAKEGRLVERGGDVRLEVMAVAEGGSITERNLTLSFNSYTRIPLYYSEKFEGVTRIAIRAFDGKEAPIPVPQSEAGGSASNVYLFKLIGPVPGLR